MNLSEHFTLDEALFSSTAARLSISNDPDTNQIFAMKIAATGMEQVRSLLNQPIHVDSWFRCPELNEKVGGAKDSAHMQGYAVDFICPAARAPAAIVQAIAISSIQFDQLIQEGTWVHISFDPLLRRRMLTAHFGPGGTTYTKGV